MMISTTDDDDIQDMGEIEAEEHKHMPSYLLMKYFDQSELFKTLLARQQQDLINELDKVLEKTFGKVIFEGRLGEELFMADSFSRSMVVFLEETLKERQVSQVEEFESFIDNLENWLVCFLTQFNKHKKLCVQTAHSKLENITA